MRRKRYVPPKRRFLREPHCANIPKDDILHSHRREILLQNRRFLQEPRCASFKKTTSFIVTAVKSSSKTPVLTKATLRNIPKYDVLHSHRREIVKSSLHYVPMMLASFAVSFLYSRRHVILLNEKCRRTLSYACVMDWNELLICCANNDKNVKNLWKWCAIMVGINNGWCTIWQAG
jgi:hypothetical protein